MHDNKSKSIFASVVPKKGRDPYAVKRVGADLRWLGYRRIVFKTDQENSITALKRRVSQEKMNEIRESLEREVHGEMVMEESPAYESQSNGRIENAVKRWQGQLRTMLDALIAKYGYHIEKDHPCLPWLVRYASTVLNRYHVMDDGKTAYYRLKGKNFRAPVAEFGECIWYLKPGSRGMDKMYSRWETGVFVGVRDESGEVIVGTKDGFIKVRTFRRKASKESRWNRIEFDAIQGTPWEPIPGREGIELKTAVVIPRAPGPIIEPVEGMVRPIVRRRFQIRKEDANQHGMTVGCEGCTAVNRGGKPLNHSEECRKRFFEIFKGSGEERLKREAGRMA